MLSIEEEAVRPYSHPARQTYSAELSLDSLAADPLPEAGHLAVWLVAAAMRDVVAQTVLLAVAGNRCQLDRVPVVCLDNKSIREL